MVIELVPVTLEPVELKPVELLQTGAAPGGGAPAVRIAGVSETGLVYDSDLIRLDVSGGAHTQTLNMNLQGPASWETVKPSSDYPAKSGFAHLEPLDLLAEAQDPLP